MTRITGKINGVANQGWRAEGMNSAGGRPQTFKSLLPSKTFKYADEKYKQMLIQTYIAQCLLVTKPPSTPQYPTERQLYTNNTQAEQATFLGRRSGRRSFGRIFGSRLGRHFGRTFRRSHGRRFRGCLGRRFRWGFGRGLGWASFINTMYIDTRAVAIGPIQNRSHCSIGINREDVTTTF